MRSLCALQCVYRSPAWRIRARRKLRNPQCEATNIPILALLSVPAALLSSTQVTKSFLGRHNSGKYTTFEEEVSRSCFYELVSSHLSTNNHSLPPGQGFYYGWTCLASCPLFADWWIMAHQFALYVLSAFPYCVYLLFNLFDQQTNKKSKKVCFDL